MTNDRWADKLVWQTPGSGWACAQRHDIKTFATKEEAMAAAKRSVRTVVGSQTRSQNERKARSEEHRRVDEVLRNQGKVIP